jgi:hypothetical protein
MKAKERLRNIHNTQGCINNNTSVSQLHYHSKSWSMWFGSILKRIRKKSNFKMAFIKAFTKLQFHPHYSKQRSIFLYIKIIWQI